VRHMLVVAAVFVSSVGVGASQAPQTNRPPTVVSPEVRADRTVVFRIFAPNADTVAINAGDIPADSLAAPTTQAAGEQAQAGRGRLVFTRGDNGVWEATTNPVPPGAFRYVFVVDGVRTIDPVNTRLSESNTATWSWFDVPGLQAADLADVPHGAVSEILYASSVLGLTRRMHVYTPPGYERDSRKYPVFYLLHGAGDSDDAWTSVGRAGVILDNLIADRKAVPMIVVMPAGHQPATASSARAAAASQMPPAVNPFTREFVHDIVPYVESHYRVADGRDERAIAGLSMGGSQTLDIAFRHLDQFAYIGVFSSGAVLGGGRRGAAGEAPTSSVLGWEAAHLADLDNARLKKGTRLIWLATGVDDRLIANTRATVELLEKHGFTPELKETAGGHTWLNWRDYLIEFTPRLFR